MAWKLFDKLVPRRSTINERGSWLRNIVTGSLYRISDIRGDSCVANIKTQIDTMRALANDSQISTALSYYATDATTANTAGDVIWATALDDDHTEVADIINALFKRWNVNRYARDHILELATIGNLYIPTTYMYKDDSRTYTRKGVVLDNNTIPEDDYDIIPSYKIPPESIVHLWYHGFPQGYIMDPSDSNNGANSQLLLPELACIHFTLGGLLGDYTIDTKDADGNIKTYDIQFSQPLMAQAVQPTQTLSLLEDAVLLSSLARTIKFINVDCGQNEEEIRDALQQVKDMIEQQLSLNTSTGDAQSFVNPQSPNNLIYLSKVNGQDALSITDLNMAEANDADNKLLDYYQDKKLSVLGVPKEAMNFSSNEGLGGAGSVLSQRSALYANALQRLEIAYMEGWTDALNKYFIARNYSGFVNQFQLHMNPIITTQSTVQFEKRDSALNQATAIIAMLKDLGITDADQYKVPLTELLSESLPQTGAAVMDWKIDVEESVEGGMGGGLGA